MYADTIQRGLIFHGSPGNGKTSTAKALMKALMARPKPVSTLVVKTLSQRSFGPQMSIRQIFTKARQTAPCLLLFEDVDSLVTDQVRSYFFNEVDGLESNEGILMIGSTNNRASPIAKLDMSRRLDNWGKADDTTVDKLDAGLSKRPSRFDRKYRFNNPSFEDGVRYCEYWRCAQSVLCPALIGHLTQTLVKSYLENMLYLSTYHVKSLGSLMASASPT